MDIGGQRVTQIRNDSFGKDTPFAAATPGLRSLFKQRARDRLHAVSISFPRSHRPVLRPHNEWIQPPPKGSASSCARKKWPRSERCTKAGLTCRWCPSRRFPVAPGFVIHVSQLAAHTRDMLAHPPVSLLVIAPPAPDVSAQALARVTIQGRAMQYTNATESHAEAKAAYLARFPQSEDLFGFADFSLFAIVPESVRFVGGFAQATTISAQTLANVLSET